MFLKKIRPKVPERPEYTNNMAILPSIPLSNLVALPPAVALEEWISFNTEPFFKHFCLIYEALVGICTPTSCVTMSAGPKHEYIWTDDKGKRSKNLSAREYIELVIASIDHKLQSNVHFPSQANVPFSKDFLAVVRRVYKLLFQMAAHIYHHHYGAIEQLNMVVHLNTVFTHFIFFASQYSLLDRKDVAPMLDFINQISPN